MEVSCLLERLLVLAVKLYALSRQRSFCSLLFPLPPLPAHLSFAFESVMFLQLFLHQQPLLLVSLLVEEEVEVVAGFRLPFPRLAVSLERVVFSFCSSTILSTLLRMMGLHLIGVRDCWLFAVRLLPFYPRLHAHSLPAPLQRHRLHHPCHRLLPCQTSPRRLLVLTF